MDSSNTLSTSHPRPHNAVYNTPAACNLVRQILSSCVPPVEPHDYQLDGLCFSLDGYDVVATMATGTGKTGFFIFLMLVIRAISRDPTLALGSIYFLKDPAMIVVCPTKALQEDMVRDHCSVDQCHSAYLQIPSV